MKKKAQRLSTAIKFIKLGLSQRGKELVCVCTLISGCVPGKDKYRHPAWFYMSHSQPCAGPLYVFDKNTLKPLLRNHFWLFEPLNMCDRSITLYISEPDGALIPMINAAEFYKKGNLWDEYTRDGELM